MSYFITFLPMITPTSKIGVFKYLNIYILKNKLKVNVDDDEKKSGTNDLCLLLM